LLLVLVEQGEQALDQVMPEQTLLSQDSQMQQVAVAVDLAVIVQSMEQLALTAVLVVVVVHLAERLRALAE
jgi:hypothetical protein